MIDDFSDRAYRAPLAVRIYGTELCSSIFTLVASPEAFGSGTELCCSALVDVDCCPLPAVGTQRCSYPKVDTYL